MEKTTVKWTMVAACFLAASLAWADDNDEESETTSRVDLRVSVFENIVVTSNKAPAADAEDLHPDIEDILEEADAVEEDLEQE